MRNKIPNTPFATRLSGSAKETQLRIRSMFQWKKKRPPVWLFAFIVVVIFGCIGLVSCREKEDVLCMGLNARVVEIDTEQMILYIQDIDKDVAIFGQRCALDCKQAVEEKKLIFVDYETSELTDIPFTEFQVGDELVISLLTSQKEGAKDATALAEQVQLGTQRPLYVTLTQVANWYSDFIENCWSGGSGYQYTGFTEFTEGDRTLTVQDVPENLAEELLFSDYYFRTVFEFDGLLGLQGSDTLRLSAENERKNAAEGLYFEKVTIHNFATLTKDDFTPGGAYFADAEKSFNFVDQANFRKEGHGLTEYAIVYLDLSWKWTEKALSLGPQLGDGRYERLYLVGKTAEDDNWKIYECFWGEYVLDRTYSDQDAMNALVMGELFTASNVSDVAPAMEGELLIAPAETGQSFAAGYFTERDNYELVIAVWDAESNSIVGTPFRAANSGGIPKVVAGAWEGEQYLLYTANGMSQGFAYGQAGEIRLVNGQMTWEWPVSGDVRDISSQAYQKYLDFWAENLALMSGNGLEIFTENPDYGPYEGSPQQWSRRGLLTGYYVTNNPITDLDMERSRVWLEEFCRDGNNGMDRKNDSASWRILELGRNDLTENCVLLCVSEFNEDCHLRVRMRMDHFGQKPIEILDWEIGGVELTQYPVEVEKIDQTMYVRVEEMLENMVNARWMQENTNYTDFDQMKKPEFRGGDIITFRPLASYADMYPDSVAHLYDLEIGLVCNHPENITLAGGNWVDGFGRLRNKYLLAYMVIEERNGQIVAVDFLGEDELYILGDDEGGAEAQRRMTKAALDIVRRDNIDSEVTLWHDENPYYPLQLGLWSENPLEFLREASTINILDGWEPIYQNGDYWDRYTIDGLSALRYYNSVEDAHVAYTIDLARKDFATLRGIQVGSTRDEVNAAYPELKSGDYWGKYPGEDYLWYCEDELDFGPALIFFFENDKVSKIVLNNMFN